MWKLTYSKSALKQIRKLDPQVRKRILLWIANNLVNCPDPRVHGKALTGALAGMWSYRVGSYRLLAELHDELITIDVVKVSHRSVVYDL